MEHICKVPENTDSKKTWSSHERSLEGKAIEVSMNGWTYSMNTMGYNLPFKRKWARLLVQWYKSLLSKYEDPSTYINVRWPYTRL